MLPQFARQPDRQRGFLNPNIAKFILVSCGIGLVAGVLLLVFAVIFINPRLPSLDAITDYRPKIPLRIYSADNVLLGEFGEEKRDMTKLENIPDNMKNAVLAIEDARFYQHNGVDYIGLIRAIGADILHGSAKQGASTITMQVARNVFLTQQKTVSRKLYEVLLANKIEMALSKDQILEVYMNHIYLGQRAYGFAAAARTYFGKDLKDITLAESAMLAGLPKAPSAYNPVVNPKRAHIRQQYILRRMLDLNFITQAQYDQAIVEKIVTKAPGSQYNVHAEFVNEMVRQLIFEQYQDNAYTQGIVVHTTVNAAAQKAAYVAVRKGIIDYDKRHGYRGPEGFIDLPKDEEEQNDAIDAAMEAHPDQDTLMTAIVTEASTKQVRAVLRNGDVVTVSGAAIDFVAPSLASSAKKNVQIRPGAIVRVWQDDAKKWHITQEPQVEAALISITPQTGAIRALIGGFDFNKNHFNHATQAWRQPGSVFKPFVYSAALEKGFGPASIINDAPVSYPSDSSQPAWEPKDDSAPLGPVTLRTAVQKSINFVAIRTLDAIGVKYAQEFITERFHFDADKIPAYLSMALGAGQTTPMQLSAAYATLANGGYSINPYLIEKVTDAEGNMLSQSEPLVAGKNAARVIDERNSYVMTSLLRTAAQQGTGALTNSLQRGDLAGKTGTTNNAVDGWYAGYQRTLATVVWMGYDQPRTLGSREFGSRLALPIWVDYMRQALKNTPIEHAPMPGGLETINGELYYDNFTPGNGFVTSLGVDVVDSIANFFGWGSDKKTDENPAPDAATDEAAPVEAPAPQMPAPPTHESP